MNPPARRASTMGTEHSVENYYDRLFHQERYTVEEVAYLLNRPEWEISMAVMNHKLRATIVEHNTLWILRHDLLEWLKSGD
jgi:hypothetical protein